MGETNIRMSPTMRLELEKVLNGIKESEIESNVFNIELSFTSRKNPDITINYSPEIQSVRIVQNYIENFTDKIIVDLQLDVQDYIALYYLRRELYATLTFTRYEPQGNVRTASTLPTYQQKFRAIILDNADIFKQLTGDRLNGKNNQASDRDQVTTRMKIELISEDVYKARKRRLNLVARDVNMDSVLKYVINFFGFSKARIIPPDNTDNLLNFVIPPDFGIADIMTFLQNAPGMGVYLNGFCSYITEGCWYVFPRHGESLKNRVVQIYSPGSTNMEGLRKYNWNEVLDSDDFTCHIIVNGEVLERNWSAIGTENRINAANIMLDELTLDNARIIKKDGEFEMDPVIHNSGSLSTDPMDEDEPFNLEFRHGRNNKFTIMSELGAYQVTSLEFTWQNCEPFIFHPGTVVQYNYDHQNAYKSIRGKCERAEYVFVRDQGLRLFPAFVGSCKALIVCDNVTAVENLCV